MIRPSLSLCLLLTACSGGSTSDTANNINIDGLEFNEPISHFGFIDLGMFSSDSSASFFRVDPAVSFNTLNVELSLPTDSCDLNGASFTDFTLIPESAGETILFTSEGNSFVELNEAMGNEGQYLFPSTLSLFPSNLVVDIPGAQYPAAANIKLPSEDNLSLSRETLEAVVDPQSIENGIDFTFTWLPSSDPRSSIKLIASFLVEITPSDFLPTIVECLLEDDGEFEFPMQLKEQLSDENDLGALTLQRQTLKSYKINEDTLLQVQRISGIQF